MTESAYDPNRNPERTTDMPGSQFQQSVESVYDESDNITGIAAGPGEDKR